MTRRKHQKGSAILEFSLAGVPLLFIWISVIQMSIAMWSFHTLQYACKSGGAYVQLHGATDGYCASNTCQVGNAATAIANKLIGILPSQVTASFYTVSSSDHLTKTLVKTCALDACETDTTTFPNLATNGEFAIQLEYQFKNGLSMFALQGNTVRFQNPWFPAYTHLTVLY